MATTKSTAPKTTSKAATKSTKKAKPASKATSGGTTSTSKKAAKPSVSTAKRAAASKTAAKKSTAKKAVPKPAAAKTPAAKKGAKKTTTGKKAASKKTATAEPVASKTTATTKSVGTKQPAKAKKAKEASRPKTKSASKAKKAKPVFDKKFLDQQVKLLKLEREKYLNSSVSLESEAQQLLETREQGDVQFDEESAEGDSWAIVREQDLALSADARATVEKIDQALLRIKDGTYGICERTGKPIPKARLKAIPWATETVGKKTHGLLLR